MDLEPLIAVIPEGIHPDSLREASAPKPPTSTFQIGFDPSEQAFLGVFQQIIDGLPEQIALVDEQWDILAVNPAWIVTAQLYGYDELIPGTNYLAFCEARANEGHKPAGIAVAGIREMEKTGERSFRYVYHGHDKWQGHSFQLCVNRLDVGGRQFATITRYDVTELVQLRQLREGFAYSMIEGQDQERRRIAREVHDSTMQLLAGLGLSLGQLKRTRRSKATIEIVDEMEELLGEAQRELRAISFLAHPPQLQELGLVPALRQLCGGFGRRAGLEISFEADDELKLPPTADVAIYRMIQEALSNVHRHAAATEALVSLHQRGNIIHVVVADNGRGMPDYLRGGVGLSSMRERIHELGGHLTIRPGNPGTILIGSIPAHADLRGTGDMALPGGPALSKLMSIVESESSLPACLTGRSSARPNR